MKRTIQRGWWKLLLGGTFTLIFGVLALVWPGRALAVLVIMFGALALAIGILSVFASLTGMRVYKRWWLGLIWGIASIIIGIVTFARTGATAFFLVILIAAWVFVAGISHIVIAIRMQKKTEGRWLHFLSGILSVLLGLFMISRPGIATAVIIVVIAIYAIVFGILQIALSFRIKREFKQVEDQG